MKLIILSSLFLIISCKVENKKTTINVSRASKENIGAKNEPDQSEDAKKWLIKSIEAYFRDELEMGNISTLEYYQYKSDATSVDMDGGVTLEEFEKNWKNKFDIKKAGIGEAFLTYGQDWGNVKVDKCDLDSQKNNIFWFSVTLVDDEFKTKNTFPVKVIKTEKGFLIADVFQKNPEDLNLN